MLHNHLMSIKSPHRLRTFLIFLTGLIASAAITFQVYELELRQKQTDALSTANSRLNMFSQLIDQREAVTDTLKTVIFTRGGETNGIDDTIAEIYRYNHPDISVIALAPAGKITYIYPDNADFFQETDLFSSENSAEYIYARNTQRTMLNISDNEVTIYNPVYLREKNTGYESFWGFSITVCPLQSILERSRIYELTDNHYNYKLTVSTSYNHSVAEIAQSTSGWDSTSAVTYQIEKPGYIFTLSIAPVSGWTDTPTIAITGSICAVLTILVTILAIAFDRQKKTNILLEEISSEDALTRLPNRRSFSSACRLFREKQGSYTIFFIDANHFKDINDTYGHAAGNEVLCEYAARLNTIFPSRTYRLGGDEFASLVPESMNEEECRTMIARIDNAMAVSYSYQGTPVKLSVSTGWAVSDPQLSDDEILNKADRMMYQNKHKFHQAEKKRPVI